MNLETNSGVYRITIGGQHIYVGSSTCLSRREYQHLLLLGKGKHGNTYMQNAWNKHQAIVFEVLEYCEIDAVIALEQKYLDEVFGQEFCMNICSTAYSRLDVPHSAKTRAKMSANSAHRKVSEAHKERLRYKRSPETIEKMRLAQQNKTSEWKEKLSKSGMGHVVGVETRLKISESLKARNKVAA